MPPLQTQKKILKKIDNSVKLCILMIVENEPQKKIISKKPPKKEVISELPVNLEINAKEMSEIKRICLEIDMSLKDYLLAVKEALKATKITIDKYGEEHFENDHDKRLKAAMIGLELEGYVRNKAISVDSSRHTHVTYAWLNAPINNKPSVEFRNGD